jgi:hypothetical protein
MIRIIGAFAAAAALGLSVLPGRGAPANPTQLVVHEWGTITTRHATNGRAEGRLNRLDYYESLADFVHRYEPPVTSRDPLRSLLKVPAGSGRAEVTMRLETPVIYFHPAPGSPLPDPFDVTVNFRGGVLNEFYPEATPSVNGWNGEQLSDAMTSTLAWKAVALTEHAALPLTSSHVWLAPRQVKSTPVTVSGGETEQYLFYRGVANLPALLGTEFTRDGMLLRSPARTPWLTSASTTLGPVWIADVRRNGIAAVRITEPLTLTRGESNRVLARVAPFTSRDYSTTALQSLREAMHTALVAHGLYPDEATAMLETWKNSYFGVPGLRVFYIVPNDWTSYYLPLTISTPHTLSRVIVGRIDVDTNTP